VHPLHNLLGKINYNFLMEKKRYSGNTRRRKKSVRREKERE